MTKVADCRRVQVTFEAAGTPTAKFLLLGDRGAIRSRASLSLVQTTGETFVTLRRYDPEDNETVIREVRTSDSKDLEIICTGYYDMIVQTVDFDGEVLVTVEQHQ
jgi:hypothetical protein